jgi:uncharacterized protein (DUF1800 family)
MLGTGTIPSQAPKNAGRPSKEVAAEFLSRKLWIEFAGTEPPAAVLTALRNAAIANDFEIRPWLKVLFTRDEFYSPAVKQGLVRSPVEFVVALLHATGRRSAAATPLWLMQGMGQRPLFPPNVSGWKHNGYWVNASAMAKRTETVRSIIWRSMQGYWGGDGLLHLKNGTIARNDVQETWRDQPLKVIDEILRLADLELTPGTYEALADFARNSERWELSDLFHLVMFAPELQVA